jgi:hypothetical protein
MLAMHLSLMHLVAWFPGALLVAGVTAGLEKEQSICRTRLSTCARLERRDMCLAGRAASANGSNGRCIIFAQSQHHCSLEIKD